MFDIQVGLRGALDVFVRDGGDPGREGLVIRVAEAVDLIPGVGVRHAAIPLLGAQPLGAPGGLGPLDLGGGEAVLCQIGDEAEHLLLGEVDLLGIGADVEIESARTERSELLGAVLGSWCLVVGDREADGWRGNPTPFQGNLTPFQGNLTPFRGNLTAFRGNLKPFRGNLTAFRGNLKPFRGNLTPFQGNLTPFQGNLTPFQGNLTPFQGNLTPFRGNLPWSRLPLTPSSWTLPTFAQTPPTLTQMPMTLTQTLSDNRMNEVLNPGIQRYLPGFGS